MNILNDISSVYVKEVIEPQLGKKEAPSAAPTGGGAKKVEKGKTGVEASAKRIRQAVYDIRYRARREGIELDKAYNQYMAHTTMSGPEKTAVKEKLGIGPGGGSSVTEESESVKSKKFQVRVTDKESGKTYVRYATREKINQLRSNPNISSVEMTQYGKPYEGEKQRGEYTAKAKSGKGLDQDGDGDKDFADVMSARMQASGMSKDAANKKVENKPYNKKSVKEGFSNWRQDLCELMDTLDSPDDVQNKKTQIKENPKINNKIVINPEFKESVENLGGFLIEMVELNEEFISESVNIASEYFYEQGLNEEGVDILIEELGLDNFVDFVFELNEEFNLNEARTLLGKKKSPQKLPKGTAPSQTTKAAVEKYGTTRRFKGGSSSSTVKRKSVAVKKAVEKQPETQATPKKTKRGILDKVAKAVLSGMERHQKATAAARQSFQKGMARHKAATSTASKVVSQTAQTAAKAAKVGAKGASEFGKGVASGVKETGTAAKKVKKAVVGEETEIEERTLNPYAVGMAAAMKATGDKPPLKKSTITKAHKIAKKVEANEDLQPTTPQQLAAQRQLAMAQKKVTAADQAALQNQKKVNKQNQSQQTSQQPMESLNTETDTIDELTRYAKETGKDPQTGKPSVKGGNPPPPAMRGLERELRSTGGLMSSRRKPIQRQGQKKDPGKKPPAAGEYGGPVSPAQKVAMRRAAAQRSQDMQSSRFD